jgi:squalene cyclase
MQGSNSLVYWAATMDLGTSVDKALTFLELMRGGDGWWWDFYTRAGFSDEWVTGYIGAALAVIPGDRASRMASAAWSRLRSRRRWAAGWGYNARVPVDADSTVWALRLAESVGAAGSRRAQRAYRLLARHARPNGGLATYADDGPIRHFTRIKPAISFEGWCCAHPSVTAAAALLPAFSGQSRALDFLRKTQSPDGSWHSYWWCDREYTSALAAEALHKWGQHGDAACVHRASEWAQGRIASNGAVCTDLFPGGSPFATALALRILALADLSNTGQEKAACAIGWLLQQQQWDGSWRPTAALRISPSSVIDPDVRDDWAIHSGGGGRTIVIDQRALFTTATILRTLLEARDR